MSGVLVLGHRGFLGRVVREDLRAHGQDVQTVEGQRLEDLSAAQWDEALSRVQVVVNAAGRTQGTLAELTRDNVLVLASLLDAAARRGVRVIHLASAAEYGRSPQGQASCEDDPPAPRSPYGAAKLAGTILLEEAVRTERVNALGLRLTNPVGPGLGAGTLPGRAARLFLQAVDDGRAAVHFGPLGAERDFISISEIARAIRHFLPGGAGEATQGLLNLGSGQARPVRAIVAILAEQVGYRGLIHEDIAPSPRSGDVPCQLADLTRLNAAGFAPDPEIRGALQALLTSCALPHPLPGI
ncbi:NAD(P)-dependent oxidoreductase [Deinococcus cavernae]|uniref:NAD(P)-dependent oxidoreductase n=1 Tax=Deinococcus cavernae TaxID=2320857 RepID=A0A418V7A2_9DEIO|nr:NAD(P)-dependent oxidoreductase [Deinococcus cavernae]RJF71961.1 NAD(P)-dependent oxidoreductase [Deinococcus cavernae]